MALRALILLAALWENPGGETGIRVEMRGWYIRYEACQPPINMNWTGIEGITTLKLSPAHRQLHPAIAHNRPAHSPGALPYQLGDKSLGTFCRLRPGCGLDRAKAAVHLKVEWWFYGRNSKLLYNYRRGRILGVGILKWNVKLFRITSHHLIRGLVMVL